MTMERPSERIAGKLARIEELSAENAALFDDGDFFTRRLAQQLADGAKIRNRRLEHWLLSAGWLLVAALMLAPLFLAFS